MSLEQQLVSHKVATPYVKADLKEPNVDTESLMSRTLKITTTTTTISITICCVGCFIGNPNAETQVTGVGVSKARGCNVSGSTNKHMETHSYVGQLNNGQGEAEKINTRGNEGRGKQVGTITEANHRR